MPKMVQIRNVPDDVHRTLKMRAAKAGMSLSDYLLRDLEAKARRPSMDEWLSRIDSRDSAQTETEPAELIRELRGPLP